MQEHFLDGIDVVEADDALVIQSLCNPYGNLSGEIPNRGGNGADHNAIDEGKHVLAGENDNGTALVGLVELVVPDVSVRDLPV